MNGNFCIDVHVEAFLGGEFDAHAVAGDFVSRFFRWYIMYRILFPYIFFLKYPM
jgi:hypothetical protein